MKNKREYELPLPSDFRPHITKKVCCKNCVFYYSVDGQCAATLYKKKPMRLHQCPLFKRRNKK